MFSIKLGEEEVTVDMQGLYQELAMLGIDRFIIEQKHHENLYVANIIVEEYNFGRELSEEEKRGIVQAIVDHSGLDYGRKRRLKNLISKLQQYGFSKEETYAIIINLGVNGSIIDEPGYTYSNLIENTGGIVFDKIKERADRVEKTVKPFTIIKAASNTLKDEEIHRLKLELGKLGIQEKELEGLDDRLIYIARRMAEEYIREGLIRNISVVEVVREFLTLKFKTNRYRGGLKIQEQPFKDKLRNMQELDELISEFMGLGIDKEYLRTRDRQNLFMAKKIIEGYRFERTLTSEEKRALVLILIDSDSCNLVKRYKKMGLSDDQEIYAKTINYKVCNKSTTQPVAEATIGISVEKAKIIMQRAAYIYHFDMWGISNSTRVRTELSKLTGDKVEKVEKKEERY